MKNRMDVPEEYEPVLPGKVKAHIEKKKAQAETEAQITWYQCVDLPNFWSKRRTQELQTARCFRSGSRADEPRKRGCADDTL